MNHNLQPAHVPARIYSSKLLDLPAVAAAELLRWLPSGPGCLPSLLELDLAHRLSIVVAVIIPNRQSPLFNNPLKTGSVDAEAARSHPQLQ